MSGMLQPNSSGMEQFGQTTIDDFRPSISPVIPDVSLYSFFDEIILNDSRNIYIGFL